MAKARREPEYDRGYFDGKKVGWWEGFRGGKEEGRKEVEKTPDYEAGGE